MLIFFIILSTLSIGLSVFLFFYARWAVRKVVYVSRHSQGMLDMINEYLAFVKKIYSLEMYYGDETIKALLRATTDIQREFVAYHDSYRIATDYEPDQEEQETSVNDNNNPTEEKQQ